MVRTLGVRMHSRGGECWGEIIGLVGGVRIKSGGSVGWDPVRSYLGRCGEGRSRVA